MFSCQCPVEVCPDGVNVNRGVLCQGEVGEGEGKGKEGEGEE